MLRPRRAHSVATNLRLFTVTQPWSRVVSAGGSFSLSVGAGGTGFRVDYTDDLDGGPWLLLTNGVLSAERKEVIDFTSTNRARRFYRTVVEP